MGKESGRVKEYLSISLCAFSTMVLVTGVVCYKGLCIELRTNHIEQYCPICGIFGLERQANKINEMEGYSAIYIEDEYGEKIEVFETEGSEEKVRTLVKRIEKKKSFFK